MVGKDMLVLVLAGTTGAGRMAPRTSPRVSGRLKRVDSHNVMSPLNMHE